MTLDFREFALAGSLALMQPVRRVTIPTESDSTDLPIDEPAPVEDLKLSILSNRDLLLAEYGTKMVMAIRESMVGLTVAGLQIIGIDPRRIRYELMITNLLTAANVSTKIGSQTAIQRNVGAMLIGLPPSSSQLITRDFKTDGDAVCLEVWALASLGTIIVSVRETFLSPLPVDEQ
jgi:hypothetical protein